MDSATWVQILEEADCIQHSTYTLGEGVNLIIIPPARGKIVGQTGFFNLDLAIKKENLIKTY